MAPEQALGRRGEIDGRVDVFALGATMFRVLSGRRVHEAESEAELLMAMASRPAPPLRVVVPETPEAVAGIVDFTFRDTVTVGVGPEGGGYIRIGGTVEDPSGVDVLYGARVRIGFHPIMRREEGTDRRKALTLGVDIRLLAIETMYPSSPLFALSPLATVSYQAF
jgi:hypothetical protein